MMPVKGLSEKEIRELDGMREQTIHQLELLRIRQAQYRSKKYGSQVGGRVDDSKSSLNRSTFETSYRSEHYQKRPREVDESSDDHFDPPSLSILNMESRTKRDTKPGYIPINSREIDNIKSRLPSGRDREDFRSSHHLSGKLEEVGEAQNGRNEILTSELKSSYTQASARQKLSSQVGSGRSSARVDQVSDDRKSTLDKPYSMIMDDFSRLDVENVTPPKGTHSTSAEGTPKSILRHRKLIDNNIVVKSKYEHTPISSKKGRNGLNFSYTDAEECYLPTSLRPKSVNFDMNSILTKQDEFNKSSLQLDSDKADKGSGKQNSGNFDGKVTKVNNPPKSPSKQEGEGQNFNAEHKSPLSKRKYISCQQKLSVDEVATPQLKKHAKMPHYASPTDGSLIEERNLDLKSMNNNETGDGKNDMSHSDESDEFSNRQSRINELVKKNLLLHSGNERKVATTGPRRSDSSDVMTNRKDVTSKITSNRVDTPNKQFSRLINSRQSNPLLGYDWIAGNLDNETSLNSEPDELFEEIKAFRYSNKDDCIGSNYRLTELDLSRPISPEVHNPEHTCIHGFSINDRLFTEPVNADEKGESMCPVCLSSRKEPSKESPGFVRVSIPASTLDSPYKIKPHRRRSFDPTDSCALAQHCLAGWECSRPAVIPTAKTIDLRHAADGIKSQMITTEEEARKIAQSVSRIPSNISTRPPLIFPSHGISEFNSKSNGISVDKNIKIQQPAVANQKPQSSAPIKTVLQSSNASRTSKSSLKQSNKLKSYVS